MDDIDRRLLDLFAKEPRVGVLEASRRLGVARGALDPSMAWAARAVGVLALAWIAWGLVADVRARRGRRTPGATAARAMWVAATRPWRAAEAVRGLRRRDRVLLVAVPAVAVAASRGIATWFEAPAHLVTVLAAWLVFGLIATLVLRRAGWPAARSAGRRRRGRGPRA